MWENIIKTGSMVAGACWIVWQISKAVIAVKREKREPLDICCRKFEEMRSEIEALKESDTKKFEMLTCLTSEIGTVLNQRSEMKEIIKTVSEKIEEQTKSIMTLKTKFDYLDRDIKEIKKEIKKK